MTVWRIASRRHAALDGEGARLYSSRWTPKGTPAVFASASLSLAALERFVHADPDLEPANLVAIGIDLAPGTAIASVVQSDLPAGWRAYPAPLELAAIGERWLREAATIALWVPSAIIPTERNLVINPRHGDIRALRVASREPFTFDPRMWK